MSGLEIKQIGKSYPDVRALDNIDLSIAEGELFFLLGPSGCGKTTLLRVIAGFCVPDHGSIRFRDVNLLAQPIQKRNIGMVFQGYSLWPHMSVYDNVAYGLRIRRRDRAEIAERVQAALRMVEMASLGNRRPGELSGGQQQRVALARALVYEPEILLLDEPLSNLDAKLRKEMRREIRALHERLDCTMIYVTHDQEEAAAMADRIALMRAGRIVQIGSPESLYRHPQSVYAAQFFGRANTVTATVISHTDTTVTIDTGAHHLQVQPPAADTPLANGTRVTAIIRPEDLVFCDDDTAPNTVPVVIREREFNGAVESYTVETDEGAHFAVLALHRPHARLATGAHTRVQVAAQVIHLIVGDAAQ